MRKIIYIFLCLIMMPEIQAFSFRFNLFVPTVAQLSCSSNTQCYQKQAQYGKAIYNGELLITKNTFLYSPSNSRYLGTQCSNWYSESELAWVNKKLNPSGTNWINTSWYYNSGANEVGMDPRSWVTPTCGVVHFREYRNAQYGYSLLFVDGNSYFGGGNGGYNYNYHVDVPVNKGQVLRIGSHYYQIGYLNAGY